MDQIKKNFKSSMNVVRSQKGICLSFFNNLFEMDCGQENFMFETINKNLIWMPGLSLALKKIQQENSFELEFEENDHVSKQIINSLKINKCLPKDIDESILFEGAFGEEAPEIINNKLELKFKKVTMPPKVPSIKSDQAILYGAMVKKIQFDYPFFRIAGKIMHFCRQKVPCFEPMSKEQRKQIFIVSYNSQDNFTARVNLKGNAEQMFIIRSKVKIELDEALKIVQNSIEDIDSISSGDLFKIPILRLKSMKESLDEITLTVDDNPNLKHKRLVTRGPFWLILRKKGKKPYFAIFVNRTLDIPREEEEHEKMAKKK